MNGITSLLPRGQVLFAGITSSNTVQVINIASISQPYIAATLTGVTVNSMEVSDSSLYIGTPAAIQVYDITNPQKPVFSTSKDMSSYNADTITNMLSIDGVLQVIKGASVISLSESDLSELDVIVLSDKATMAVNAGYRNLYGYGSALELHDTSAVNKTYYGLCRLVNPIKAIDYRADLLLMLTGNKLEVRTINFGESIIPEGLEIVSPASGVEQSEGTEIEIAADGLNDDNSVVEFIVDGMVANVDSSMPYTFMMPIPSSTSGTVYTLNARARNVSGNSVICAPITILVVEDNVAPTFVIAEPAQGASVTEGEQLHVSITDINDNVAVQEVSLSIEIGRASCRERV